MTIIFIIPFIRRKSWYCIYSSQIYVLSVNKSFGGIHLAIPFCSGAILCCYIFPPISAISTDLNYTFEVPYIMG